MKNASFLSALAVSVLDTLCTEKAAKAARVEKLARDFPWSATKAELSKERDELRKAYVVSKYMGAKNEPREKAEIFVAANYKGISTDGHVLRKFFDAAKTQMMRDLKNAAELANGAKGEDEKKIDVLKVTGGAAQVRGPRASKEGEKDAPAPVELVAADAPAPTPVQKVDPATLAPSLIAFSQDATKAARKARDANRAAFLEAPTAAEAWREYVDALAKASVILAKALNA